MTIKEAIAQLEHDKACCVRTIDRIKRKNVEHGAEWMVEKCQKDIEALDMAIEALKEEPRIKAKWKIDWDWGIGTCSHCNHDFDDSDNGYFLGSEMRFCPFCGAKMDKEEEE